MAALQGTGTQADPYLIGNLADLEEFSQAPDAPTKYHAAGVYTAMSENVDCTGMENWNGGKGMLPIGADSSTGYYGNFNGNKRRITNLYIDRSLELTKTTGFFGYVNGATISGLRLTGAVKGNGFATASVVGIAENSTISECESSCDIYGVGGGQTYPPYADSNGGIVGIMRLGGSVSECVFTGTINSTSSNLHVWGGVVGSSFGVPISDCNAISTINVFNSTYTGGFIGYISGNVTITNCYSVAQYYAFCGLNQGVATIVSCYYNGDIDEGRTEPTNAIPKTTGQMETQSTYTGWDFSTVWLAEEEQYPQLLVFVPLSIVADPTAVYALAGDVVEMSAVVRWGQQPQTLKLIDTSTGTILSTGSPYSYLGDLDDAGNNFQWEATDGTDTVLSDLIPIRVGDPILNKSIELFSPLDAQCFSDIRFLDPFGDLDREEGLDTTVFLSLFTEARALDSDILPNTDSDRRGWWGDSLLGISTGSKEWLITERGKLTQANIELVRQYRIEAIDRQMIQTGLIDGVDITYTVGINSVEWTVVLKRNGKSNVSFEYETLWDGQLKKRGTA